MSDALARHPSSRIHHKRTRLPTAPEPRPSRRVFNPDTFRTILKVALHMTSEHLRTERVRAMVQAMVDDEPPPGALYDAMAAVSKLTDEISPFIHSVLDVEARCIRPGGP